MAIRIFIGILYIIAKGIDMLPKKSTHVDQKLESESIGSKLSVAIFMVSRNHLGTRKCSIYRKKSKKGTTRVDLVHWLLLCTISRNQLKSIRVIHGF